MLEFSKEKYFRMFFLMFDHSKPCALKWFCSDLKKHVFQPYLTSTNFAQLKTSK